MLIKMLRHGTGSAARAASYVLDEKDHEYCPSACWSVEWDPHIFAKSQIVLLKHNISRRLFAEEDQPTDIEIKDVLKQFEALLYLTWSISHDGCVASRTKWVKAYPYPCATAWTQAVKSNEYSLLQVCFKSIFILCKTSLIPNMGGQIRRILTVQDLQKKAMVCIYNLRWKKKKNRVKL